MICFFARLFIAVSLHSLQSNYIYTIVQYHTKQIERQRAALYIRVSTDEQIKGYGLSFQKDKIESFIESQDYVLSTKHIYSEEGFSGTLPVSARPALSRLFEDAKNKEFDVKLQIGLIAQEVENIFPELVETDNQGYKSVEYSKLVAVLIEAMKEQQKIIDEQKVKTDVMNSDISTLKAALEILLKQNTSSTIK